MVWLLLGGGVVGSLGSGGLASFTGAHGGSQESGRT